MHKIIAIVALAAAVALCESDWWNDILVWSFDGGLVSAGNGYQIYDGLYGGDFTVYASAVEYRPGNPEGDRIIIRKSFNNGQTWPAQALITTGDGNVASTPRIVFCDNGESLLLFVTLAFYNGETAVCCYKYATDGLTIITFNLVDRSYPGMGAIRSSTVNPGCGGVYHVLMETEDNWLFISSSSDGVNWSPAQPLAANAVRASATGGPGSKAGVAWYDIFQQAVLCVTGDQDGFGTPVVVSPAHADAAPIPVWENSGAEVLGVVWHNAENMAMLSLSEDEGSTWGSPFALSPGSYPFADIFSGTVRVVFSLLSPSGEVLVGNTQNLSGAGSIVFETRNEHQASTDHPAVVRHGGLSSIQGMFYISATEEELWFDNSMFSEVVEDAYQIPGSPGLSVQPNPSSSVVSITVSPGQGEALVTLFSLDGRAVWSGSTTGHAVQVGVRLPAGVYLVNAVTEEGSTSARMLRL
ncbi:MAG: T9SS type A sorting domain-containing protein [Candidatus Fermentibacteraceae bacterium]